MNPIPHPAQPVAPLIQTRRQLEAVIENIVELQCQRAGLESAQEAEIATIREKYRAPLAEVQRYLTLECAWAETWARSNPGEFGEGRLLDCDHATIGFRVRPPYVDRASRKWIWSAIAAKLAESDWGRRYLRVPAPEVDKEALLADCANYSVEDLRLVGIKIVHDERFFVTPHGAAAGAAEGDSELQEAA